ncbi:MAG: hypothetical protein ACXVKN_06235 [Acidimicrobiia bacterium]
MTTANGPSAPAKPYGRGRRITVAVLLIVASILAPLSVLAVWTKNTLLDSDQYVSTVAPLAKNPAIIDAAANEITASLVSTTDVQAKVKAALPAKADFIAPAVASSLETVVHKLAVKVMSSPRFQALWERANRRAHTQVVKALTGNSGHAITTNNGQVAINLGPVVDRVRKRLDSLGVDVFSGAEAKRISPRFVLFQSEDLKSAQSGVDLLQKAAIVLPILALLLFAAAIAISRNRRKTVLHAGLGISIGMLVILTAFNVGRSFYLDAVTTPTLTQAAAAAAYDQLLNFLRLSARTGFVLGIIVAIGAWLAGPSSAATRVRSAVRGGKDRQLATEGFAGWVARSRTGLRIVIVAAAALVLVAWSHPKPVTVLVVTILVLVALAVVEILARGESEPAVHATQ